ncbi:hypothetical protein IAT38_004839 [Cryptococcus sp. DSM 104549]
MYFPRLLTLSLLSLASLAAAVPTLTTGSDALAKRYHEDHKRHHPATGSNARASASASGVKRKPKPTAAPTNLPLGAAVDLARCPAAQMACPVTPMTDKEVLAAGPDLTFECVSPQEDLYSCGGCATLGTGLDCTAIAGVNSVSCVLGTCQVHSCQPGYAPTSDGEACNPVLGKRRL